MSNLKLFNFKDSEIRTFVSEDNKPLFVAKDIASALGYSDPGRSVREHCKDGGAIHPPIEILDSMGRKQEAKVINESDVYRLIMKSRLPEAEQFQDWVVEEVLPSIREHGAYATALKLEEMLNDPDTMIKTLQALKKSQEEARAAKIEAQKQKEISAALEVKKKEVEEVVERQKPWVEAAKALKGNRKGLTIDQVAKTLIQEGFPVTVTEIRKLVEQKGFVFKNKKKKEATAKAVMNGMAVNVATDFTNSKTGYTGTNMQAYITLKGIAYLIKMLPKWGYNKVAPTEELTLPENFY